jgi:uncharacterized protein YifE (UPF0438 family)
MASIVFNTKAQLERFPNGKMEVLLESADDTFLPYDLWEEDVFERYEKKFKALDKAKKTADEEKVKSFLLQFAKMKQKEPLFKEKKKLLELEKLVKNPISGAWKDIHQKGYDYQKDLLKKRFGLEYKKGKFIKEE